MTVSSLVPVNSYAGNSYCKKFDFDFLIESGTELYVQHTDENGITTILKEGIDYSINEIGNKEGSYITFPLETSSYGILKENEKIALMLTLVIKQESEFRNSSYFNFNILEWTFDYIVRILQIINRKVERCIKVREGDEVLNEPDKFINNLKIIEFNTKTYSCEAEVSANLAKDSEILAKDWSIKTDDTVDGKEYSAKHYSLETKNTSEQAITDINSNKDRAINEINTTQTNAVNNVNNEKNNATKAIQELVTQANNAAQRAENEAYKVLYPTDTINQSKALETGNISGAPEIYNDIYKYAHSTFDLSKFTVVGNPIISDDGIASGFSNGNYLTTTQTLGNSIKIYSTFKTPSSGSAIQNSCIWQIKTSPTMELQVVNQKMLVINSSGQISAGSFAYEDDTWYSTIFEYDFTTGDYKLSYKKLTDNNYTELAGTKSDWVSASLSDIVIDFGTMNRWYFYSSGSIDLKKLIIKVDEQIVFSGNITGTDKITPGLEIPYTLSKTGSKIVDAKYRDRVQDMYEQFGYAPYYTLDETNKNFTLPMGEIYGMLEKNRQNLDDILRPIGKPLISMNNDTLNFDEIWLEGAKVLKETYPKLAEVYGDTYAPLEAEDTDTYLYLPDFRERTVWGSSDGSCGYIEAGLPNITGTFTSCSIRDRLVEPTGAFKITNNNAQGASGVDSRIIMEFNASLSDSIYGKSTTVQPPSFKVRFKTRFK